LRGKIRKDPGNSDMVIVGDSQNVDTAAISDRKSLTKGDARINISDIGERALLIPSTKSLKEVKASDARVGDVSRFNLNLEQ
jgi:hypothetical protein